MALLGNNEAYFFAPTTPVNTQVEMRDEILSNRVWVFIIQARKSTFKNL